MHTNHSFMCTSLHCKAIVLTAHNQAFNIGSVYLNLYSRWRRVTFNFLFLLKFRCIYHEQWNRVLTNEQTKWQDSDLLLIRIVFSPALCEKKYASFFLCRYHRFCITNQLSQVVLTARYTYVAFFCQLTKFDAKHKVRKCFQ